MKDRPKPCFKCGTEPATEAHQVCSSCHDDRPGVCHVCYPPGHFDYPLRVNVASSRRNRVPQT